MIIRTHKIRLHPSPEQEVYFYKAAGTARYAYNWAVSQWRVAEDNKPSAYQLKKQFNAQKPEWAYEVTKCAAEGGFMDFGDALSRLYNGQNGEPQFKTRNRGHFSFYLANDKFSISGYWIRIPKLGLVNIAEKLRFHGKILKAQIRKHGKHWYACIVVEMPDKVVEKKNTACGVDVGISHLATLSDGTIFNNLRPLKYNLQRLANLQRVLARKQKGSRNRERIKSKIRQLHQKICNIRDDVLHKMTTKIAKQYHTVALEDLNVKGMTKNHCLAQALQDSALGRLHELLEGKVTDRKGIIVKVNRFFPSSKLCSCPDCDGKRDNLTLSDRVYHCQHCGLILDRDHNAARNILQEGVRILLETHNTVSGSGYDGQKTPPETGYNPNISPICGGGLHFCIPNG